MGIDWNKYVSPTAMWTRRTAPMALEVLLDFAKVPGTTLTYERLAQVLLERYGEPEMHNKQHYGKALGAAAEAIIGEAKAGGISVPPITVIVVSKATGYASRGADQFVDRLKDGNYAEHDSRRQEILKQEQKKVWNFGEEGWTAIQVLLGHRPLKRKARKKVGTTLPPAARGGKGEGVMLPHRSGAQEAILFSQLGVRHEQATASAFH